MSRGEDVMTAISVTELRRAWIAVESGEFRSSPTRHLRGGDCAPRWEPDEPTTMFVGATGNVGTSTIALATATAADAPVRVLEVTSMHRSGYAHAATAELGVTEHSWKRACRGSVVIERTTATHADLSELPPPGPTDCGHTLVDLGWDWRHVAAKPCWLASQLERSPIVAVTCATEPGMRALNRLLDFIADPGRVVAAVVVGADRKKWHRELMIAGGAPVDEMDSRAQLHAIAEFRQLKRRGITPEPFPPNLVAACQPILDQTVEPMKGTRHDVQL